MFNFFNFQLNNSVRNNVYIKDIPSFNALSFLDKRKRIPLLDLVKKSAKTSWRFFDDGGLQILDFVHAIRQAGLDGELKFWGRPDRNMFEGLTKDEPLHEIPKEHWRDFTINWGGCFSSQGEKGLELFEDNFEIGTYNKRDSKDAGRYKDIYIENRKLSNWIKKAAKEHIGRTAKRVS